jgi:regulator of replication initiation timing
MGGNGTRVRKQIVFFIALLTCLSISSYAFMDGRQVEKAMPEQGARERLAGGQKALAQRNYQASLQELEAALSLSGNKPPGDEALFNMAMVYGDPENPKRDYPTSITFFQRLTKEYPQSSWVEPARIWTETLKEQGRLKRVVSETLQENKKVKQLWNDALKASEGLKQLSNETAQENQRLKQLSNETAQENRRLKEIIEQSKAVDVEVEKKKKGQGE